MKSHKVILLLGGNEKNTFKMIKSAITLIQKEIGVVNKYSSTFLTAAWGPIIQPDFLNLAIIIRTQLPPLYLLQRILSIENRLGRSRTIKYGPRAIDIDLLFYGNKIIKHRDLIVPHPQIPNRKFVLLPLNEIIPKFIHPHLKLNIKQLLRECQDTLEVKKWSI